MAKPALDIIKATMPFTQLSDADLLQALNKVHDGMLNNAAYPNPPVDMAGLKAAIDTYTAAVTAALDGGKTAIVARDKRRKDVLIMLRLLAHYVESACKNDMPTFISSGFEPAAKRQRIAPQPVSVPSIAALDQGSSGQLLVTIQPVAHTRSYEIRYAPIPAAGANITWTTILVASTKPATRVNNLLPGTTYTFQVRAFGKLGFSDWSASFTRMCI